MADAMAALEALDEELHAATLASDQEGRRAEQLRETIRDLTDLIEGEQSAAALYASTEIALRGRARLAKRSRELVESELRAVNTRVTKQVKDCQLRSREFAQHRSSLWNVARELESRLSEIAMPMRVERSRSTATIICKESRHVDEDPLDALRTKIAIREKELRALERLNERHVKAVDAVEKSLDELQGAKHAKEQENLEREESILLGNLRSPPPAKRKALESPAATQSRLSRVFERQKGPTKTKQPASKRKRQATLTGPTNQFTPLPLNDITGNNSTGADSDFSLSE